MKLRIYNIEASSLKHEASSPKHEASSLKHEVPSLKYEASSLRIGAFYSQNEAWSFAKHESFKKSIESN